MYPITPRKYFTIFIICFVFASTKAQEIVFSENFESFSSDLELINSGYSLETFSSYEDDAILSLENDGSNYTQCYAPSSGQAIMQFRKTIILEPFTSYNISLRTLGVFKRKIQILQNDNLSVIAQSDDISPSEEEKTKWIVNALDFTATEKTNFTINIYHNWSGTISIDDIIVTKTPVTPKVYHLSNSVGKDSNLGSADSPWKTIDKVNTIRLGPGDQVLFQRGDTFKGHLNIKYSGTQEEPITIGSYGLGDLPLITGQVGIGAGGDYQEAIFVENQDNLIFQDIEVNNERLTNREGISEEDAYGIYILNSSDEIQRNYTFRNITFKKVYAPKPVLDPDSFNGLEVAAVRIESKKNSIPGKEKNIENVLMEACYFSDLQRLGVHIKHLGADSGIGSDEINCNKDLVFRNNEFHNLGGTCILPVRTYNCLIEKNIFDKPGDNSDPRMPNRGSSVWTWRCHNTVIQYNKCLHIRGYLDSHGIHIDHANVNTFVQYNYMEDCEGGFVEILGGNINAVYRFNISVNDGWRNNPDWSNSNHTLWINEHIPSGNSYSDFNYIYNNTIYIDNPYTTAIDINGKNTFIYNNIFHAVDGGNIGGKQVLVKNNNTPLFMKNNLFEGAVSNAFKNLDKNAVFGESKFQDANNGNKFGFQLETSSDAIDAGITKQGPPLPGAGVGIFAHIPEYPNVDFYGNAIDLSFGTPNIGACNAKNGEDASLSSKLPRLKEKKITWSINNTILFIYNLENPQWVKIYSMTGQLLIKTKTRKEIDIHNLQNGIYLMEIKGKSIIQIIKK